MYSGTQSKGETMITFILARIFRKDYRCKDCKYYVHFISLTANRDGGVFCVIDKDLKSGAVFCEPAKIDGQICRRFKKVNERELRVTLKR